MSARRFAGLSYDMPVSLACHICHFFTHQIFKSLFYIGRQTGMSLAL
jgi:hypothetical protein